MTEKITAICQECGEQFEYTLKPGFPRKYCFKCSEIKKASYAAKQPISQDEKKFNEDMEAPVVRPGLPQATSTQQYDRATKTMTTTKEFHLSPEQVNTNALDLAIKWWNLEAQPKNLMDMAQNFKEFIENGN